MSQEVKMIPVEQLVLWTENPRDPIDESGDDQMIAERAMNDVSIKWDLTKLAKEMGLDYDFSELPTVVYHGKKPVVYDGNRRMVLAKIKLGYVHVFGSEKLKIPTIPTIIPCNVCSEDVALQHVLRKHSGSGSWRPLERDIFLHKFMKKDKTPFLVLDEATNLITSHPVLNKGFVRDELLTEDKLKSLGFVVRNNELLTVHNNKEAKTIFSDIANKVESKAASTRAARRNILRVLESDVKEIIEKNKSKKLRNVNVQFKAPVSTKAPPRQARRVAKGDAGIFGGPLYLKASDVNNLYRDIAELYQFYLEKKTQLSESFPAIIRMSLRLLCETSAVGQSKSMGDYLKNNFDAAKATLTKDDKTTLSGQNVKKETIEQLLHTGAHNYKSAVNLNQTLALSLIIGAILTKTYGRPV